ncbi:MAG: tetratricopeptide repeat protein [candidate division WOR-3 bacterium]|nr:MAG: tetratricopeptide repeat protein [candidate division WOR-3 bacterium]
MAERDFTEIARLSERYNKDPKSRIFVQLADAYRKNNMIEEALDVLQKGLEHHPDYPLAHLIMGKCRFDKRMYAQAKESFQKTLEFDPQNVVALRMLAQTCEITNDEEGQITAYKGLLTIDPFDDQAREKLSQLEAKYKKEPMFTLAMAEEYEKQGNLEKALEIYKHLRSTDPSDLVVQQKITTIEDKITEHKKTIEAKKIESMQVETVFKPEQIEEKLQEVQKPQPETQPTPPSTTAPPAAPKPDVKEDLMPLEDFLAESKEEPAVPPKTAQEAPPDTGAAGPDIIDEKLDLLEPFKPEEPTDKVEKLDILEPVEADTPKEPAIEQPAPPPFPEKTVQAPAPEPRPEKTAPVPEPSAQPAAAETPQTSPPSEALKDEVIILQPPGEKLPEPSPAPAPEPTKEEPAVTPPEQAAVPPIATPGPGPAQAPQPTPAEETPAPTPEPRPAPAPQPAPAPEPSPAQAPEITPTPAPEAAPEPRPAPASEPEKAKEEPKPKPKEEDFQSFQDWLSGLIK